MISAVVFDLGGVVLESPLATIASLESEHGIASGTVTRHVGRKGSDSAWSRLERGQVSLEGFISEFSDELGAVGIDIPVREMMLRIEAETRLRPIMVRAIERLRGVRLTVAALTNNWPSFGPVDESGLRSLFDVFVESCREGVNKPDPAIYSLLLERLARPPAELAYLDDIGRNLKPARELGMTTIKVIEPESALAELGGLLGLSLV